LLRLLRAPGARPSQQQQLRDCLWVIRTALRAADAALSLKLHTNRAATLEFYSHTAGAEGVPVQLWQFVKQCGADHSRALKAVDLLLWGCRIQTPALQEDVSRCGVLPPEALAAVAADAHCVPAPARLDMARALLAGRAHVERAHPGDAQLLEALANLERWVQTVPPKPPVVLGEQRTAKVGAAAWQAAAGMDTIVGGASARPLPRSRPAAREEQSAPVAAATTIAGGSLGALAAPSGSAAAQQPGAAATVARKLRLQQMRELQARRSQQAGATAPEPASAAAAGAAAAAPSASAAALPGDQAAPADAAGQGACAALGKTEPQMWTSSAPAAPSPRPSYAAALMTGRLDAPQWQSAASISSQRATRPAPPPQQASPKKAKLAESRVQAMEEAEKKAAGLVSHCLEDLAAASSRAAELAPTEEISGGHASAAGASEASPASETADDATSANRDDPQPAEHMDVQLPDPPAYAPDAGSGGTSMEQDAASSPRDVEMEDDDDTDAFC
jgi:hypothetical protein